MENFKQIKYSSTQYIFSWNKIDILLKSVQLKGDFSILIAFNLQNIG